MIILLFAVVGCVVAGGASHPSVTAKIQNSPEIPQQNGADCYFFHKPAEPEGKNPGRYPQYHSKNPTAERSGALSSPLFPPSRAEGAGPRAAAPARSPPPIYKSSPAKRGRTPAAGDFFMRSVCFLRIFINFVAVFETYNFSHKLITYGIVQRFGSGEHP